MIITQTPLRVGLVGGGTDLPDYYREHGGRVLNCAIDKYVYVIVKQRFDDESAEAIESRKFDPLSHKRLATRRTVAPASAPVGVPIERRFVQPIRDERYSLPNVLGSLNPQAAQP
jgi:hypothetical protein